jgi:hypothetical protein
MKTNLLLAAWLLLPVQSLWAAGTGKLYLYGGPDIYVSTYGAIPNDGIDDAVAIQQALTAAVASHSKVIFAAGRYDLKVVAAATYMNSYVGISTASGVELEGAVDAQGKPATCLVKYNPQQNNTVLPGHLYFNDCSHLAIRNLVFDNFPQYATAGEVVEKNAGDVTVKIFAGLPISDSMGAYCANVWDLATRNLKKIESLSFIDDVAQQGLFWRIVDTTGGEIKVKMSNASFASKLQVGDGVSWHYGAETMFQVAINNSNNVTLSNLLTVNIAGWGIHTYACNGITAHGVRFKATGQQLAVGARDAWKMNQCNGQVSIDSMSVEGVRWDGQNVHSIFLTVVERLTDTTIKVFKNSTTIAPFINDSIGFWNGGTQTKFLATKWVKLNNADGGAYGVITTSTTLPASLPTGTLVNLDAWDIDHYVLSNSSFKNIAGCASVIKNEKVTLQNVTYDYIMYPAVVIGTEITAQYEGTFPQHALLTGCSFSNSGWVNRIGLKGLVGIGNDGTDAMAMGTIHFENCHFENGETGIDMSGVDTVKVFNSTFQNVERPFSINHTNTDTLMLQGNTYNNPAVSFTAGSIAVVRIGDGLKNLGSEAAPVFLDEYNESGTLVQSIPMPVAVSGTHKRLTLSGNALEEGYAGLSPNGSQLALIGYDANTGTSDVKTTTSALVNRTVALVSGDGTVNTTTALSDAFSGVMARAAVADSNRLWLTGGNGGIRYTTPGATTTLGITGSVTGRVLGIYKGQLYASSQASGIRIGKVGTGKPVTAGQTVSNLPGFPVTGGFIQFFFADLDSTVAGVDVLYAADNGAGLYKYSLSGGNWISNGNIAGVYFGITGKVSGGSVTIFAARKASGKNESELVKLTDNSGYNGSLTGTPTKLTTSAMYTVFRGLSLCPAVTGAGARHSGLLPAENTAVPGLLKEAVSGTTEMKITAANGLLTVMVNAPVAQRATLAIYDISGRKQLQTTLQLAKGNNRFQLDNPVQKGPAVAQLLSGSEKIAIKFIHQ